MGGSVSGRGWGRQGRNPGLAGGQGLARTGPKPALPPSQAQIAGKGQGEQRVEYSDHARMRQGARGQVPSRQAVDDPHCIGRFVEGIVERVDLVLEIARQLVVGRPESFGPDAIQRRQMDVEVAAGKPQQDMAAIILL